MAVWSAAIASLSLIAALVFNGIQVQHGADAQRQAKEASELALLAGIQEAMTKSVYSRVPFKDEFRELNERLRTELSDRAYRVVAEEAENMNYFAWLFNNGYLDAEGADELLGPQMLCELQRAFAPVIRDPAREIPDLIRFKQERGPALERLAGDCA